MKMILFFSLWILASATATAPPTATTSATASCEPSQIRIEWRNKLSTQTHIREELRKPKKDVYPQKPSSRAEALQVCGRRQEPDVAIRAQAVLYECCDSVFSAMDGVCTRSLHVISWSLILVYLFLFFFSWQWGFIRLPLTLIGEWGGWVCWFAIVRS